MLIKDRINKERARKISRKLKGYERLRGGRTYVCENCNIATSTWYRAIAAKQITIECAERIENFLSTDNIKKL